MTQSSSTRKADMATAAAQAAKNETKAFDKAIARLGIPAAIVSFLLGLVLAIWVLVTPSNPTRTFTMIVLEGVVSLSAAWILMLNPRAHSR